MRRFPGVIAARGTSDHAAVYGKYLLFTYEGLLRPSTPIINVDNAPSEWRWLVNNDKIWMEVDPKGNVLLQVPEPATWILLLSAGLIGLVTYARRRRRA